jgi:hypothetical protein
MRMDDKRTPKRILKWKQVQELEGDQVRDGLQISKKICKLWE